VRFTFTLHGTDPERVTDAALGRNRMPRDVRSPGVVQRRQ